MDYQHLRSQEIGQDYAKKKLVIAIVIVVLFGLGYRYRYELQEYYKKLVPAIKALKNRL